MRFFYFTEQPYPQAWDKDDESVLVTLPNHHYDPQLGADLLNRYVDEYAPADELGFNIMVNEHHSSSTCLSVSGTVPLAVLARETKRAHLLVLGIPIANRRDPVRIAEEISYIDCLSRGRIEFGMVKGSPFELGLARFGRVRAVPDTAGKVAPQFKNPPSYVSVEANAAALKQGVTGTRLGAHFTLRLPDGSALSAATASSEELVAAGVGFAGTPDDVYNQIVDFNTQVDGIGNIIFMAQGGFSDFDDTRTNLTLFAKEVMPRLADLAEEVEEPAAADS